jgi:ESCRT-II complex subunit VPS22
MKRRPGIAGLQAAAGLQTQYRAVGAAAQVAESAAFAAQVAQFKASLEAFALKYKADIRSDPVFRAQFQVMCSSAGVDPLASNKGFWAQLLGLGDFYYELAVQLVEAAQGARQHSGALVDLSYLVAAVSSRRGAHAAPVTTDDCLRAIGTLRALGGGCWDVLTVGKQRLVRCLPTELSRDGAQLLSHGTQAGGALTLGLGCSFTSWAPRRVQEALDQLLREGVAWLDSGDPDGEPRYWFPGLLFRDAATAAARDDGDQD